NSIQAMDEPIGLIGRGEVLVSIPFFSMATAPYFPLIVDDALFSFLSKSPGRVKESETCGRKNTSISSVTVKLRDREI
ncbi:MAG: hypothetical protein OEZ57_01005, partial [Nitrospirota bacterium]|nr:hypothetical protein [Nitrospirota bacterium]